MKIDYFTLLKDAQSPPEIEINGKTFVGKLISYEHFLNYEEALYEILQKPTEEMTINDLRQQYNIARSFLKTVFPVTLPPEPERPAKGSLWEKIRYIFSSNRPPRWQKYEDELAEYLEMVQEIIDNDPVAKIMELPPEKMWEVIRDLFTYQRGLATKNLNTPSSNDSQSNQELSEKEKENTKPVEN